jgi:hypothetical protein
MPAVASADGELVGKLIRCLVEVIEQSFETDDRAPGYLMPIDVALKPNVFVQRWNEAGNGVYSGMVESGQRPPQPGEPYRWTPPGTPLGVVWFRWPTEPNDVALAFKVAEWLLILEGRQKADYQIKPGPVVMGIPSIQFSTGHNGFGACQMGLIHEPG